jgi:hypothetical protein
MEVSDFHHDTVTSPAGKEPRFTFYMELCGPQGRFWELVPYSFQVPVFQILSQFFVPTELSHFHQKQQQEYFISQFIIHNLQNL